MSIRNSLIALTLLVSAAQADGLSGSVTPQLGGNIGGTDGGVSAASGSVCSDTFTLNGGAMNDTQDFGYGISPDFNDHAIATTFTIASSHGTCSAAVVISMSKAASPTDNVTASIQADASGIPSGINLATASVAASTLGGSFSNITFPAMSVAVSTGSKYWLVMSRSGSDDATNFYHLALWDGSVALARLNKPGVPGWYTSYSATFVGSLTIH
jgi:hypothetical protein